VLGDTIISKHCNDILCCVDGADCVEGKIIARPFNDILCCVNVPDCVCRYINSETL